MNDYQRIKQNWRKFKKWYYYYTHIYPFIIMFLGLIVLFINLHFHLYTLSTTTILGVATAILIYYVISICFVLAVTTLIMICSGKNITMAADETYQGGIIALDKRKKLMPSLKKEVHILNVNNQNKFTISQIKKEKAYFNSLKSQKYTYDEHIRKALKSKINWISYL